jgi:uncharacterized protein YdhG (YjbR/CyaY superfamily)
MNPKDTPEAVDVYISGFPDHVQELLNEIRSIIRKAAPQARQGISYGIPTFKLNGYLVHFGAYEKHIGFYPTPSGIEHFKQELSLYEGGKGSIKFPLDQAIPWDLIRQIVEFRVAENIEKLNR